VWKRSANVLRKGGGVGGGKCCMKASLVQEPVDELPPVSDGNENGRTDVNTQRGGRGLSLTQQHRSGENDIKWQKEYSPESPESITAVVDQTASPRADTK